MIHLICLITIGLVLVVMLLPAAAAAAATHFFTYAPSAPELHVTMICFTVLPQYN
jgi:hypothetical protein